MQPERWSTTPNILRTKANIPSTATTGKIVTKQRSFCEPDITTVNLSRTKIAIENIYQGASTEYSWHSEGKGAVHKKTSQK